MKNLLLAVFIFLMAGTFVSQAQKVVDNFDSSCCGQRLPENQ